MLHVCRVLGDDLGAFVSFRIDAEGFRAGSLEDFQGMATWGFKVSDLRRIGPKFQIIQTSEVAEHSYGLLWLLLNGSEHDVDDIMETDPEVALDDDEIVSTTLNDAALVALRLLAEVRATVEVTWESEGSAFWFFHDLRHVMWDAWVDLSYGDGGSGGVSVDHGEAETRATVHGAFDALRAGVSVAEIAMELVDNVEPFRQRFGYEPDAIGLFFDGLRFEVKE